MSFLRDLPSVQQSLVYKMRPERISVLSESLPSLSSLYDAVMSLYYKLGKLSKLSDKADILSGLIL